MPSDRPLVLDTHVWVWLINGDQRLSSSPAFDLILGGMRRALLRVSAISVWEVAVLVAKGRLKLASPVGDWVSKALAAPGIRLAPLEPEIAVDSTQLPGQFHSDPADRIIVATARHLAGSIVTADRAILGYAAAKYVSGVEV